MNPIASGHVNVNRIFAKLHSTGHAQAATKWPGSAPGSPPGRS